MSVSDIERHDRPPHSQTVLSDLLGWLEGDDNEVFANLFDWKRFDFDQMSTRMQKDRAAKPRIEISAEITKMNNLSVRWHPGGWAASHINWDPEVYRSSNLIQRRVWQTAPDFRWFEGDEEPTFNGRATNELMYLRGVGNLRPEPPQEYYYATYNYDVVDSILLACVGAAVNNLIENLKKSFEVELLDEFAFSIREEHEADGRHSISRIVGWELVSADEMRARRLRAQEDADRDFLKELPARYGFTLQQFVATLVASLSKKASGPAPSVAHAHRATAKLLRSPGTKLDAGDIARIRALVERLNAELLPPELRPKVEPQATNVVKFPLNS